jgi:hypothetical protein
MSGSRIRNNRIESTSSITSADVTKAGRHRQASKSIDILTVSKPESERMRDASVKAVNEYCHIDVAE